MFIEQVSDDSIFIVWLITNYCVPNKKYSQKHVYIVYFRIFKFWRGGKKMKYT